MEVVCSYIRNSNLSGPTILRTCLLMCKVNLCHDKFRAYIRMMSIKI